MPATDGQRVTQPAPGDRREQGAVLFDVDGTLVDSVDLHALSWQEIFAQYGKQIPFEEIRSQIGKGADQLIPVFFSADEVRRFGQELEKRRAQLFRDAYMGRVRPFPKVRELFERIHRDGILIALASSAGSNDLDVFKRIAEIDDLVDEEITSEDVDRSKPHPDLFAAALEALGRPQADRVLVVGDSPYDAEAAGKIGLQTIGLLCGGFAEADLRAAGCVAIYRNPGDLLDRYPETPLAGLASGAVERRAS